MNASEITQIITVLSMLRQSTTTTTTDEAINLQREARILLVALLQSNGVDTDKL